MYKRQVFVGSGIFKSEDPANRAKAVVKATTHYNDPGKILEASRSLKDAMNGIDIRTLEPHQLMQNRS